MQSSQWVTVSTQDQNAELAGCLLSTLKSKTGNQKGPRRENPVQRRKPGYRMGGGGGGLAQGPKTKEGTEESQILGPVISEGFPKPLDSDPKSCTFMELEGPLSCQVWQIKNSGRLITF